MVMRVIVTNYDPNWPSAFESEAEKVKAVFGDELAAIYHIGSTSVPGLPAKPIIDILLVVRDIEQADQHNGDMIALGYEPMGEFGLPGRRYFRKGGDNRTHQIHAYQADNTSEIGRHLAFRDYLRAHPAEAAAYGALKEQLAGQFPEDIQSYMDGKDSFIKDREQRALAWWKARRQR